VTNPERPLVGFDLDGVVMQNPFEAGVEPRILAHLRESPALRRLHPEEADRRARTALREAWGKRAAAGEWVALYNWDSIYTEVSEGFGGEPAPDVAALVEECCGLDGMVRLLPGARTGLDRLRCEGFRVAAITNGYYAYQWPVLRALGVAEDFERVVSPEAVGYAKPDPRLFEAVPGLLAHVGDSLVWDVLGANRAGIFSVWLDARLPPELRALPIPERTRAKGFPAHLDASLQLAAYKRYHPEATLPNCTPDAVVTDLDEAAELLISRFGVDGAARTP
jgi:FMN phosphatase YigB (HAD superfamily)